MAIVEKWNPHARIRQDLFGCIDLLALKEGSTLAVQTTVSGELRRRVDKVQASDAYQDMIDAGWTVVVHGWVKRANGRWECRIENC